MLDDGEEGCHGDDGLDSKKGEDFDVEGDSVDSAASTSALAANPLEAPPPALSSCSQGPLELTNPSSELISLGKVAGCCCATRLAV